MATGYKTNKSFLARFANNSNSSLALNQDEAYLQVKCINEVVTVRNEKKAAAPAEDQQSVINTARSNEDVNPTVRIIEQGDSNKQYDENQQQTNDVNIKRFVQDKSKMRSQFMQRFGTSSTLNTAQKRQIYPQIITDETTEVPPKEEKEEEQKQQKKQVENNNSLTASLAASLAVTITQPFLKMQNDFENKMDNVLKQLEVLKNGGGDSGSGSGLNKNKIENDFQHLNDVKLQYIEKLQENQFQLMNQIINVMNKETTPTNTAQMPIANEKLNDLINNYRNELMNLNQVNNSNLIEIEKFYKNNSNNVNGHNEEEKRSKTRSRSSSKKRKSKNKAKSKSKSKSPSVSPNTTRRSVLPHRCEPDYEHLDELRLLNKNNNANSKPAFLQELLEGSNSDFKTNDEVVNVHVPNKQPEHKIADKLNELKTTINDKSPTNLLFDKYLKNQRQPINIMNDLNDAIHENIQTTNSNGKNSFTDIQDALKDIENSKQHLEENIKTLWRNRDNGFLYCLTGTSLVDKDENERLRIRKLVDGYLNAISSDIEKEALQELIDQTRNVKLEAEKDVDEQQNANNKLRYRYRSKIISKQVEIKQQPPKVVNKSENYLKSVYGKELVEKIKKSNLTKFDWNKEQIDKLSSMENKMHRTSDDVFDRIINSKSSFENLMPAKRILSKNKIKQKEEIPVVVVEKPKQPQRAPQSKNVTVVVRKENKKQAIEKQILPNISQTSIHIQPEEPPSKASDSIVNNEYADNTFIVDDESTSGDDDDTGTGITYSNKKPKKDDYPKEKNNENVMKSNIGHLIQPLPPQASSEDIHDRLKSKDILENKAIDWIEQEIMARFLSKMSNFDDDGKKDPILQNVNDENDDDEDINDQLSQMNDNILLNILGKQGFQLFVDYGLQPDNDLIQSLIREVLEEEIISLISKQFFNEQQQPQEESLKNAQTQLNINEDEYRGSGGAVKTPQRTPVTSPVTTPRQTRKPVTPVLTPHSSVNEALKYEPPQKQPEETQERIAKQQPQVIEVDDEIESLIESLGDENHAEVEFIIDQNLIIIPKTPEKTPRHTPSPPSTPQITPQKVFKSISIQCEQTTTIIGTVPQTTTQYVVKPKSDTTSTSETFTESTQFEDDDDEEEESEESSESTTIETSSDHGEEKDEDEGDDSYMSEGVWLISKSEGQVDAQTLKTPTKIPIESKVDTTFAIDASRSEGEVKAIEVPEPEAGLVLNDVKQINLNTINSSIESGEVELHKSNGNVNGGSGISVEPSDGEIDAGGFKSKFTKPKANKRGKIQHGTYLDKKIVNLRRNNKQSPLPQNTIYVEPINDTTDARDSRDSREYERKLFSSTPDTSSNLKSNSVKKVELPNDIANYRISTESVKLDEQQQQEQNNKNEDIFNEIFRNDQNGKNRITINVPSGDAEQDYQYDDEQDVNDVDTFISVSDIDE